ncbi:high-affinity iron transporter [Cytobacillus firmus]|uniref:High-affinity iron transporter n=2 Tax=Cytobacillus TaxID=2675230 RepID=A0A366K063_CYTFI|nr:MULTISPECIES: FTR1 family protein [Cytobacillus]RBP94712.1 high-affinity iron transporter [Cytobacillus firmus]TDX43457.1 high-affinity iron transporter [Cytobacillus oceanisediminis]
MKKLVLLVLCLYIFFPPIADAEEDYSDLFILVGDAIMKVKADDWETAEKLAAELDQSWQQVEKTDSNEAKKVGQAISKLTSVLEDHQKEETLQALTNVSHALVGFEKEQNPVDKEKQREEVKNAFNPILEDLSAAITEENAEEVSNQYRNLLAMWNRKEKMVRDQSIPHYGKIETQMGFLRISLTQDEKDFAQMRGISDSLSSAFREFVSGKEIKTEENNFTLQTLADILEEVSQAVESGRKDEAVEGLQQFLTVWPSVEGDVRTRNGSLYTKLESEIPVIAGKLSSSSADLDAIQKKILQHKQAIELLQEKQNYTFWDAALIMLREGMEALLIVSALIAFLNKANARDQQKWIWAGAAGGFIMSIAAAVFISQVFSAATAGANREVIEGVTGIIAVIMMMGVGVWLHQKSNMKAWNQYIEKQLGSALSKGSIISMSLVSFLSIFREGAETIIFYGGMAPSISKGNLLTGIGVAVVILSLFAFLFIRYSKKIAFGIYFKIATALIYFLAFKILGVSIHALQITNKLGTTQISSLPIINWMGFYPTWESAIPQLVLVSIFVFTSVILKKQSNKPDMRGSLSKA